ncbi:MAG: tetratricopeptide repeat protein [Segetibacter sp.]|nr:tetratricopeptide repeat protein [Segetibacter sp.]
MGKVILIICLMVIAVGARAQDDQSLLIKGNELYKNKQYDEAANQYKKAADINEKNPKVQYNLGNALYRSKKNTDAQKAFDAAAESAKDETLKSKALYNKGVTYSREKKLLESIDAYKETLKLNPADDEARENLQKALNELKKQPPQQQKQDQKKQDQNKNNKQNNSPQNKSKLNQKQAERMLNALRQEEKKLQQNKQRKANTGGLQAKDW